MIDLVSNIQLLLDGVEAFRHHAGKLCYLLLSMGLQLLSSLAEIVSGGESLDCALEILLGHKLFESVVYLVEMFVERLLEVLFGELGHLVGGL